MAKREKQKVIKGITTEVFEVALSQYANANIREAEITVKMDSEITAIRDQYTGELSRLTFEKKNNFAVIQAYCDERPQLFVEKKSLTTLHGTVGYRTGTPQIKQREGFTWEKVLQLLKDKLPAYVRKKEEIDKKRLLADREDVDVQQGLLLCGMKVCSDETFYIDLKNERHLQDV
jgi:phage host-nuclease inhibitor protein Gam